MFLSSCGRNPRPTFSEPAPGLLCTPIEGSSPQDGLLLVASRQPHSARRSRHARLTSPLGEDSVCLPSPKRRAPPLSFTRGLGFLFYMETAAPPANRHAPSSSPSPRLRPSSPSMRRAMVPRPPDVPRLSSLSLVSLALSCCPLALGP